jgi:hypothetical protein
VTLDLIDGGAVEFGVGAGGLFGTSTAYSAHAGLHVPLN